MQLGLPREAAPGETRVALVPADIPRLARAGWQVVVQRGAGQAAGFPDAQYKESGAMLVDPSAQPWQADAVVCVQIPDQLPSSAQAKTVVGLCDPLGHPQRIAHYARQGISVLALELIPRTTRAQSMDVLSSMATLAGYRAVLLAAIELPRMFPLMITAAGTLAAARVLVIGAGVAGLQAIATARRLGGTVSGYDIRPAAAEQIASLGAKVVKLDLETAQAEGGGGYAAAQDQAFYDRQRRLLGDVVAESDVVITTAAVPGQRSPLLIDATAVRRMPAGSVIVDLAAERGGNCELTRANERVQDNGVLILGPTDPAAQVPRDASQMFSRNVSNLLLHLTSDGKLHLDLQEEITAGTLATHQGRVVHARLRELIGATSPPDVPHTGESNAGKTEPGSPS
jgi:NAD(P) transhydrogenase subunit alpha